MTIPKCKHCEALAMPNTRECIAHHNERLDALWEARWARFETLPFEEGTKDDPDWTPEMARVAQEMKDAS